MPSRIVCDVDGCLVPGRGKEWDFAGLAELAKFIDQGDVPFTLCSGRPATFMEALARQLMIKSYLICENGSMLFHPMTKVGLTHPNVSEEFMRTRPEILRELNDLIKDTPIVIELGKDVMISVNSPDKSALADLESQVADKLKGSPVEIMNSGRSIEVVPRGVTKAAGLAFWAELEGTTVEHVVSIGDADNDLTVLGAAGTAAAPANCTPNVSEIADYVSDKEMVRGVLDIVYRVQSGKLGK